MNPDTVYRSHDARVIETIESRLRDYNAAVDRVKDLPARYGFQHAEPAGFVRGRSLRITGLNPDDCWQRRPASRLYGKCGVEHNQRALPAGWRVDSKTGHFMPALRTPEGKQLKSELAEYEHQATPVPGMPEHMMGSSAGQTYFVTPQFAVENGVAYMPLGVTLDDRDAALIDADLWESMLLSEWHAMREGVTP